MWSSCKRSSRTQRRDILKFGTVLLHSNWTNLRRKYLSKIPTDIIALGQKHKRFREFQTPFPLSDIPKTPCGMYARVPHAMAQFVLKIENLFHMHIMGTALFVSVRHFWYWGSPNTRHDSRFPGLWLLVIRATLRPFISLGNQHTAALNLTVVSLLLFALLTYPHVEEVSVLNLEASTRNMIRTAAVFLKFGPLRP